MPPPSIRNITAGPTAAPMTCIPQRPSRVLIETTSIEAMVYDPRPAKTNAFASSTVKPPPWPQPVRLRVSDEAQGLRSQSAGDLGALARAADAGARAAPDRDVARRV